MEINQLIKEAHENAVNKGFWEDYKDASNAVEISVSSESNVMKGIALNFMSNAIGNRLMLIVSEAAEAQEALRKNDADNFKEELADVAIRLADLCGGLEIDLEAEILNKMEKNKSRPYKHGKAF